MFDCSNLKKDIDEYLSNIEENKEVDYALVNKDTNDYYVIASNGTEELIEFSKGTEYEEKKFDKVWEWDFNFESYLFDYLNKGFEIQYMSDVIHYAVWQEIERCYPDDYLSTRGLYKYIEYCKNNNISKEYLDEKVTNDTPDIMKYFGKYKEIEKKIDYDKSYFTFVLGYEMLNNMLSNSKAPECDVCYDFCEMQVKKFMLSQEYLNSNISAYDALRNWINERYDIIKSEFLQYSSIDYKFILEKGKIKNMPVALIENAGGKPNTYLIAFDYKVSDNETEWSYAIDYDENINKARTDFEKILDGKSLDMNNNRKKERDYYYEQR